MLEFSDPTQGSPSRNLVCDTLPPHLETGPSKSRCQMREAYRKEGCSMTLSPMAILCQVGQLSESNIQRTSQGRAGRAWRCLASSYPRVSPPLHLSCWAPETGLHPVMQVSARFLLPLLGYPPPRSLYSRTNSRAAVRR